MKTLNPAHLDAMREMISDAPYMSMMNLRVTELDYGICNMEVPMIEGHLHAYRAIHGGVYAGLIDTAAYWACYCEMEEDEGFVSLDLTVHNLVSVKEGTLFVEGRCIELGRTMLIAEAKVKDERGRTLAYGSSKLMRRAGLKTATQLCEGFGLPPLPPKFLADGLLRL